MVDLTYSHMSLKAVLIFSFPRFIPTIAVNNNLCTAAVQDGGRPEQSIKEQQ